MNFGRLLRMSPGEIRTRALQAYSKRWAKPPAMRLIAPARQAVFVDPPPPPSREQTEKLCRHRFDLLGYRDLDFGFPIDWHYDPVNRKRSPRIPWYRIPFLDYAAVGDHKVIWELNRHQHLVILAQAGFTSEVAAQWKHWQSENVYPTGINWASTLEVALRALSWLWVRSIAGDFDPGLLAGLHLHGWYIERFLSTYYSPNTHLLGEGVALFALGVMCPELAEAQRWLKTGWEIVLEQSKAQVRADGFHFEQSVYYHIYALDFFRFAGALADKNHISVPDAYRQTIKAMQQALESLMKAGPPPNYGDDDGGHVIIGGSTHADRPARSHFPATGIYALNAPGAQLFIDGGPQGAFSGGHGHADALSIQLNAGGRRILIDPGTFCYVCPERDRFRGTAAHNTLQIDGRDQAAPNGPFGWSRLVQTTVDQWHSTDQYDFFAAHHDGYAPCIHRRVVFSLKLGFWLVRDLVTGSGRHRLDINWHFLEEDTFVILPAGSNGWERTVERWDWSPVYGRKEAAQVMRFSTETALPAEFAVMIAAPPGAGRFQQTGPSAYRYQDPRGTYDFTFGEHFRCSGDAGEFTL